MHRLFEGLSEEKQARIINGALEEFTKNGFEKASTNVIVKNAGISKGALFKYFQIRDPYIIIFMILQVKD